MEGNAGSQPPFGKDDFHGVPLISLGADESLKREPGEAGSAQGSTAAFLEEGERLGLIRDPVERVLTTVSWVQYHLRRRTSMPRSWPSHCLNVAALVRMFPEFR
jgi:hypothetical protein